MWFRVASRFDFRHVLAENMAKAPKGVYDLLEQVWTPARAMMVKEAAAQQALISQQGGTFALEPWDWWYYTEKVRKARFDLDEQALRPYFKLQNVREGMFYVANRLWGVTFTPLPDLPVYNPEVEAFEVKDADGTHKLLAMLTSLVTAAIGIAVLGEAAHAPLWAIPVWALAAALAIYGVFQLSKHHPQTHARLVEEFTGPDGASSDSAP